VLRYFNDEFAHRSGAVVGAATRHAAASRRSVAIDADRVKKVRQLFRLKLDVDNRSDDLRYFSYCSNSHYCS
jgi:hypothetical protein